MKINFLKFLLVIFIGFSFSVVSALFSINDWKYIRSISLPSESGFARVAIPFDRGNIKEDFSDVRIINQNGTEVPYLISRDGSLVGGNHEVSILNKSFVNGTTQFIADLGDQSVHTGISFSTDSPNYKRQVKIYSSDKQLPIDSGNWALVTDEGYIFKFTDAKTGFTSGRDSVNFSSNTSRFLTIVIGEGEEGPISINGAIVSGGYAVNTLIYSGDFKVAVLNNPIRKTTEITANLGSNGYTTNAMTIHSSDTNFNRRVVIESSSDNANWEYVGDGSISSIKTSLFSGSSTRVTYPEQKKQYIRLSITNDDNRTLDISPMSNLEGVATSMIFESRTGETYNLYYGNPESRVPTYDISRISSYIEQNKIPVATIGGEKLNEQYIAPKGPTIPYTESHKWLLNTVLVLLVILLTFGLIWYLKKYMRKE